MGTLEQEYWERRKKRDAHFEKLLYATGCGIITGIGAYFLLPLPPWLVGTGCRFGFLFGAETCMYVLNRRLFQQ